ncbi:ribosome hibernation-promoting factor, HPF/YfiA family [Ornithinimicrobium pratense]|uniref:Ribosome hibernation promoting factor n=1 Tax=Ornithinimicrobium pratense TaxID=2593973 RepID=A0A5J6V2U6_9MICO|nr:ribosome-associated translation inhibitor RaiA [Ornithinimicrobium pratense]QFG68018.1 ribosome-associated translation inhibitor RaiA [Ornithinimicrobium pratense]
MELTVTGRKKDISERFRRHLEDKLSKIPQLTPRVRRTEVVLTRENNPRLAKEAERCEITCYVHRTVVRAEAAADEEYAALDLTMSKLTERLRRLSDKRRVSHTGKHRLPSVAEATFGLPTEPLAPQDSDQQGEETRTAEEAVDEALQTQGNSPIEIREKVHSSGPMTLGEALSQMELVGHEFFLYHDADTDQPSVVYRRRGWSYGVLRLQHEDVPEAGDDDEAVAS